MRLSRLEVAAEVSAQPEEIERYVEAGIVHPDDDGSFSWADVQRIRSVTQFLDAGVAWEHMRWAIERGLITFAYADAFFLEPSPPSGRTYAEYRASLGPAAERLPRVFDTLGLAEPPPNRPMRKDEEVCLAELVDLWTRVGGEEALLRATRLAGDHVRAIVEGWMSLWIEKMRYVGVDPARVAERQALTLELGRGLTDLLPRLLVWAEQRYLEAAMTAVGVEQVEEMLAEHGIAAPPEQQPPAVMFVDLAGFSRVTEAQGDEAAVTLGTVLRDVAERAARGHAGRVVKLLGDGAMLTFGDPRDAIAAGRELLDPAGWDERLPEAHIGLHAGRFIERDGDIYGSTVNIAARLSGVAGPGELLASGEVVAALDGARPPEIEPIGPIELRNIARPVTAFRLRR